MAVTTNSAKIKFWLGNLNYTTESLTLPSTTLQNKLTLSFDELISDQLTGWGESPTDIYVLLKVSFAGEVIYKNSQYDSVSSVLAPTNPDITIEVDESSGTEETATVNNYVPVVLSGGVPVNGLYTVEAKFVWWVDSGPNFDNSTTTFTANLSWEELTPSLSNWYDNLVPKLSFTDTQEYELGGTTADVDTEFALYPPENRAVVVRTYDNIQNAVYATYFTGGNEMKYTVLLTYTFSTYIIVNAQQTYESFTVFDVDYCKLYDCLNEQWQLYNESTCSGKLREARENQLIQANALVTQIITGLGCEKDTLSGVIAQFNELTGCNCGCLTDGVRQLASENIVTSENRQSILASTATTSVDLSEGGTVFFTVSSNTTIDVTNIEQYGDYRFIFLASSGGEEVSFDAGVFTDDNGNLETITLTTSGVLILDFYTYSATTLTLVSRSDADDASTKIKSVSGGTGISAVTDPNEAVIVSLDAATQASLILADTALQNGDNVSNLVNDANYLSELTSQSVSATAAQTPVDLSLGGLINVSVETATTELSVVNIVEDEEYLFIFTTNAPNQEVTFDTADFLSANPSIQPVIPVLSKSTAVRVRAISATTLLVLSRSDYGVVDSIEEGVGISVNATNPIEPVIGLDAPTQASLALADSAIQSLSYPVSNEGSLGAVTTFSADVSGSTQMFTLDINTVNDLTISISDINDIVDGKTYVFMISNNSGSIRNITFSTPTFREGDYTSVDRTINDNEFATFTFIGVDTSFVFGGGCVLVSES